MRHRTIHKRPKPTKTPPKDTLAHIDDLIRTAKGVWLGLLAYLAYVGVTLLGVEDADFFLLERQTDLPLIGVSIPTTLFFAVSPTLGAMLFIYLHQYLLKLWEGLANAPATVDKVPLGDAIAPWLVADYALSRRGDGAIRPRPMRVLSSLASISMAFLAAPFVLAMFWWWSMPKHDEVLTVIFCGIPLAVCIYAALVSWVRLRRLSRRVDALPLWGGGVTWALRAGLVALSGLGWMTTEGTLGQYAQGNHLWGIITFTSYYDTQHQALVAELKGLDQAALTQRFDKIAAKLSAERDKTITITADKGDEDYLAHRELETRWWMRTWAPQMLVPANLANVVFVETPPDWLPYDQAEQVFRRAWCADKGIAPLACGVGPLARDANGDRLADTAALPYQQAQWCLQTYGPGTSAETCSAEFAALNKPYSEAWQDARAAAIAKLPKRDFTNIDLRRANLSGARIEGADLTLARMEGADLSAVRMEGANLFGARMDGADLGAAWMEGAFLVLARMDEANLSGARMEGAKLWGARMEGANLNWARMDEANLSGARMEGADLRFARMEHADLLEARYGSSTVVSFGNVPLAFADVSKAYAQSLDFSDTGISTTQINSMFGDGSVTLPNGISPTHPDWPAHWPKEKLDWDVFTTAYESWLASQP